MADIKQTAASLLSGVSGTVKRFEAKWRETGEKYNIFKVAGIADKEVRMCRVLADWLDPQGQHRKGSRYLALFWKAIAPKLRNCPALDFERTRVTPEYRIDENRRIDIALEDGAIFVPIEVKIRAGDQSNQVGDYSAFARTKNKTARIPVLYLTLDGHEPSDDSKADAGKDDYVCLSFKDDILPWLEACLRDAETEKTVPIRENLKQLIAAIQSLCEEQSEEAEMEDAIFKLVTQSDDTVRAALKIRDAAADFDNKALEAFQDSITERVAKGWPDGAEYREEEGWKYLNIPIRDGKYELQINYLWDKICVQSQTQKAASSPEGKALCKKMNELFKATEKPDTEACHAWYSAEISWPSIDHDDDDWYNYRLCKLYLERPLEVVDKIISIARDLENVAA
jgi:hypothetical protein